MMPGYLGYVLYGREAIEAHKMQVRGCMYVTGRAWWDVCIYNPKFGGIVHRVERDKETQDALSLYLPLFLNELRDAKQYLLDKGLTPYNTKVTA
jgi:predicted solute-binding protein